MEFPLSITVKGNTFSVSIAFPKEYPPTAFRKTTKRIGFLEGTFDTNKDTVYIDELYVLTNTKKNATEEDRMLTKGLGKKMVCAVVHHLVQHGHITKHAILSLLAMGGTYTESCKKQVDEMTEMELDAFFEAYPRDARIIVSLDHKKELYCTINENKKLVRYYSSYGLVPAEGSLGSAVDMSGSVSDVLRSCLGKRSKRSKRSKRKTYMR